MEVDQEILALLSKLGHHDLDEDGAEVFFPEKNPAKTLRDIRKILNKDIEDGDDFSSRTLADVHAIRQHFIPLLLASPDHEHADPILDESTKLFVLLTLPDTPSHEMHADELRGCFVEHAVAPQSPLFLLVSRIETALTTDASKRSEEDRRRVDLLFYLVRNLLLPSGGAISKEEFLEELHKESVFAILLHFTVHVGRKNNREWNLLLLDIYFHLFRGISADSLAGAASLSTIREESVMGTKTRFPKKAENVSGDSNLSKLLAEVRDQKRLINRNLASRHSNFGGVFQVIGDGTEKIIPSVLRALNVSRSSLLSEIPSSIAQRKRRVHDTSVVSREVLWSSEGVGPLGPVVMSILCQVSEELAEKAYAPLFTSLIQDFRREDSRIKQDDEVRFVWMIRFFTRYVRLHASWKESSIMTTMDVWSFQFMVGRVHEHLEQKAWASLETDIGALLEMILTLRSMDAREEAQSLRNAVFYELRERLEIIPRLLKLWEPAVLSRVCLRDLTTLADAILDVLEDMAEEGALAKAQTKARIKAERKQKTLGVFNLSWSAEESFALSEGVKARNGHYDLSVMRNILKDVALGPIFEEQKRTPQQLLARWMQIRGALSNGKTLDQFVREDLEAEAQQDKADDTQAEEETGKDAIFEKQVDFFSALRSYMSNNVYRNFSRLVDPALHPEGEGGLLRESETLGLVAKFFRRLRAFKKGIKQDDSMEPILWHLETLSAWRRFLFAVSDAPRDSIVREATDLASIMQSSLRRLFRLGNQNKSVLLELMLWRTKQDNVLLSRAFQERTVNKKPFTEGSAFDTNYEAELEELENPTGSDGSDSEEFDDKAGTTSAVETNGSSGGNQTAVKKNSMNKPAARRNRKVLGGKRFQVDAPRAKKLIAAASRAGATSGSFLALVAAFESAEEGEEIPFVPHDLSEDDKSLETPHMMLAMLELGMRPPNRNVKNKTKLLLSCETYWRIPASTRSDLTLCAELVRSALVDDEIESHEEQESLDVGWCLSEDESTEVKDSRSADEDDEVHSSNDDESSSEDDAASEASKSKPKLSRRVVQSDDEMEEEQQETPSESGPNEIPTGESNIIRNESSQKRRRVVVSDDEDD